MLTPFELKALQKERRKAQLVKVLPPENASVRTPLATVSANTLNSSSSSSSFSSTRSSKRSTQNPFALNSNASADLFTLVRKENSMTIANNAESTSVAEQSCPTQFLKVFQEKRISNSEFSASLNSILPSLSDESDLIADDSFKSLSTLPLDLNPKTSIEIHSSSSFAWLKESTATVIASECQSLLSFAQPKPATESVSAGREFQELLGYWAFPARPFTAGQSVRMSRLLQQYSTNAAASPAFVAITDQDELALYKSLSQDWRTAFRSAYNMFKNGFMDEFYFLQGRMNVFFQAKKSHENAQRTITATMATSTYSLRRKLEDENISFEMPNKSVNGTDQNSLRLEPLSTCDDENDIGETESLDVINAAQFDELALQSNTQVQIKNVTFDRIDDSSKSMLIFSTSASVHSLFDFLINQTDTSFSFELPNIVSLVPFELASLQRNKFSVNKSFKKIKTIDEFSGSNWKSSPSSAKTTEIHGMTITGLILPSMFSAMLDILRRELKKGFSVKMKNRCNYVIAAQSPYSQITYNDGMYRIK